MSVLLPRLISSDDGMETFSFSQGSNKTNKEVFVKVTSATNDLLEDCCSHDTDDSPLLHRRPPRKQPRCCGSKNIVTTMATAVVSTINEKDVLLGRGGGANHWIGNTTFRALVHAQKRCYEDTPLGQKYLIAAQLVKDWNASGGRFLERIDPQVGAGSIVQHDGHWRIVSENKAFKKTFQCLRSKQGTVVETVSPPIILFVPPSRINTGTTKNAALPYADEEHDRVRCNTVEGRRFCSSQKLPSRTTPPAALFIPIVEEEDLSYPGASVHIQSSSTSSSSAWSSPRSNQQSKNNQDLTKQDYNAAAILQSWNEDKAHEAASILHMTKLSPMKSDEIRAFRVVSPATAIADAASDYITAPAAATTTTTIASRTRQSKATKMFEADESTPLTPPLGGNNTTKPFESNDNRIMTAWLLNQPPRQSLVHDITSLVNDEAASSSSSMRFAGAPSIPLLDETTDDNDDM